MLRLASLSTLALPIFLLACGNATIANGNGGGGSGGTSSSSSSSSSSGTGGAADTCTAAGGTCAPIVPDACANGTWGDASTYSCGQGVGTGCCLPKATDACTAAGGTCVPIVPDACMVGTWGDANTYPCGQGVGTGCCLPPASCGDTCTTVGAVRCVNGAMEKCDFDPNTNCAPVWMIQSPCGANMACNSDGSKCVASPATTCAASSDCGCGCGCINGACECTGGLPPSCTSDSECGPTCSGFHCIGGACVAPACTPGADQTCNENLAMQSFAGTCEANATCTCKPGFTKKASGKCG